MPKGSGETSDADEHRRAHHGGVGMLIGMSVRDLDLSADQKVAVEKIRADMQPKLEPLRAAARDLSTLLADGVAAGSVDKAKVDKAIDKLVAQTKTMQAASSEALGKLHAVLTPAQRAALVDKVGENWEKWKASHGQDEKDEKEHKSGHLLALVHDLGLTQEEAQKIKAAFQAKMKPAPQDHEHKEVQEHLQKFGVAFKAEKFDPKTVSSEKADSHMARWGATRRAMFLEAAAPVLTPDQRTKLADKIRSESSPAEK
jgi:Spy/CpxP family protein refolding chaperone